jgi:hypothetical protein
MHMRTLFTKQLSITITTTTTTTTTTLNNNNKSKKHKNKFIYKSITSLETLLL